MTRHHLRTLAIAPSSRGVGYAVIDDSQKLADWVVKGFKGDKNASSLANVADLIHQYKPKVLVIEDGLAEGSKRHPRIRILGADIKKLAVEQNLRFRMFSRRQVMGAFFKGDPGTKQKLAELIGQWFPAELGDRIPRKRRPWTSVDSRMDIFDAVALALMPITRSRSNNRLLSDHQRVASIKTPGSAS